MVPVGRALKPFDASVPLTRPADRPRLGLAQRVAKTGAARSIKMRTENSGSILISDLSSFMTRRTRRFGVGTTSRSIVVQPTEGRRIRRRHS